MTPENYRMGWCPERIHVDLLAHATKLALTSNIYWSPVGRKVGVPPHILVSQHLER